MRKDAFLRMLDVGKKAVFGAEPGGELVRPKTPEDGFKFKPIPHNARSTGNLIGENIYRDTEVSKGPNNMGRGPFHFVSGVDRDRFLIGYGQYKYF